MALDPSTLLTIITVGISIFAFQDRRLLSKLILSPSAVVYDKQWYRVITHAFIHADWMHLLFNMLALWSFGNVVVIYFGYISDNPTRSFYAMYFIAIIISSIPDLVKQRNNPGFLSLGASGAVSAVVFSAIFFDPWNTILIFFIPCPGILFGVVYLLYSSYMAKKGGGNINHHAHLYGSAFGFIFPLLLDPGAIQIFIEQLLHPRFFM